MPFIQLVTSADLPENAQIPDILEDLVSAISACDGVTSREVTATHSLAVHWAKGSGCQSGLALATVLLEKEALESLIEPIATAVFDALTGCFLESLSTDVVRLGLEVRCGRSVAFRA